MVTHPPPSTFEILLLFFWKIPNYEGDDCDVVHGGDFQLTPPSLSLFSLAEAFALSVSAVLTGIELNNFVSFHFYCQSLLF